MNIGTKLIKNKGLDQVEAHPDQGALPYRAERKLGHDSLNGIWILLNKHVEF